MGKKKYRCVPLELMRKVEDDYPDAWAQMAYIHSLRGSEPDMQWPEWCYAPMAAASAIVTNAMIPDFSEKAFFDISSIFALAPWRLTRQVYAMDADLERELIDSEPATKIPTEILHRLPYQSFYVQTADISVFGHKIDGFFVTLEYDVKNGEHELRLLPVSVIDKPIDERMASTIRHNRARGTHDVDLMSGIVAELHKIGRSDAWLSKHLGMDMDEILRLKQLTGLADLYKDKEFSRSWKPGKEVTDADITG